MEAIFDTVFGNILVLLAIVGGIVGFIKDRSKKETESSKHYPTPKPTRTPSGGYDVASEKRSYEISIENQQGNQMKEQQTHTHRKIKNGKHDAIVKGAVGLPSNSSTKKNKMKRRVGKNLSKDGLVNAVIMSEVLGPPRATKPYRSIVEERRK